MDILYHPPNIAHRQTKNLEFVEHGSIMISATCTLLSMADGFVCVEVLRPSQPNGVMSSAVSLPNHTFTGQA